MVLNEFSGLLIYHYAGGSDVQAAEDCELVVVPEKVRKVQNLLDVCSHVLSRFSELNARVIFVD